MNITQSMPRVWEKRKKSEINKNENMNKDLNKRITEIVCQAWNELDASLLESILSEDFEYISVWVFETMKGKDRYKDYIKGKFETIRKGNNPVSAEVVFQEEIDKYIVVLNQGGKWVALEPTIQDNMLISLWMRPIEMTLPAVFTTQKPIQVEKIKEEKKVSEEEYLEDLNNIVDKGWVEEEADALFYQEYVEFGKTKVLKAATETCPFCGHKLRPVFWGEITPDVLQQKKEKKIFIGEDLYGKMDKEKPEYACENCGESFLLEKT